MTIILLIISAIFRALDQMMRWAYFPHIEVQSWLPKVIWQWEITPVFNAEHTYMAIKLITFGLAFYFYPQGDVWWKIFPHEWMNVAELIILYYQYFNLNFHVVFRKPKYMSFPFFRFLQDTIKNYKLNKQGDING